MAPEALLSSLASPSPLRPASRSALSRALIFSAASRMASVSTSEGSPGASASSSSFISSMASRWACTLRRSASWYLSVDFFHTNVNLLALASILVPSRK